MLTWEIETVRVRRRASATVAVDVGWARGYWAEPGGDVGRG